MKKDYRVWVLVATVVILIILLLSRMSGRSESGTGSTGDELSVLRENIKNMEKYKMRERYTSPNDNNGMTIAGTLLEQFLDISIEVCNQPLVKEVLDKIIKDSGDARVLSGVIEDIGGVIKESIKKNDLLQCLTKLDCIEETEEFGEGADRRTKSVVKCRVGDTAEFVEVMSGEAGISMFADGPRWNSDDKKNCHRYKTKDESFVKIVREVQKKIGEMFMDPEKQKLYYDTFVQIGKNNTDFLINHHAYINVDSKRDGYINPFDEGGQFLKQMPRDHAFGEMTKFGQAIKEGKMYYAGNHSKHVDIEEEPRSSSRPTIKKVGERTTRKILE